MPGTWEARMPRKSVRFRLRADESLVSPVGAANDKKVVPMGVRESDHCIVLRDGNAVHMGKAVTGRRSPQWKQDFK